MHSSYALASEDFSVERNGASEPLSALWPNGWQPHDRLGVLLANPMDAVGCRDEGAGTVDGWSRPGHVTSKAITPNDDIASLIASETIR